MIWKRGPGLVLVGILLIAGCAAPQSPSALQGIDQEARPAVPPKRIVAGMMSDPPAIASQVVTAGSGTIQGGDALEDLVNAGLSIIDNHGTLLPQLAETVPSVENGLWKLLPDGRMETTWRIRDGARWHDGTPFTAGDLSFTVEMGMDRELPIFGNRAFAFIEQIDATDARTVTARWKQPYIQADRMFTRRLGMPRPAHILAPVYAENKESVTVHPYWTEAYVGTGPYKLRRWMHGSHMVLGANDAYVLGQPKITEIEVRFIPDANTLIANVLAGEVEVTLGRNLSLSQALQIRDQWKDGKIRIGIKNWFAVWPQLFNPGQPLLLDVQFRRALLHAIDREQLVETMQEGLVPVAHTFVSPSEPVYRVIEPSIVKYAHDPRRTAQIIESLGHVRGGDGVYRNATAQPLSLEVRTDGGGGDDAQEMAALAVNDAFRRVGIAAEPLILSQAQRRDREYNSMYPGVRVWRLPNDVWSLDRYHSSAAPMPANRFAGGNRSRYMSPAFDALIEQYMSTVSERERVPVLGQIVHHMTDQLTAMGLWYNTEPILIANRLQNVTARDIGETTEAWNAHGWDVR